MQPAEGHILVQLRVQLLHRCVCKLLQRAHRELVPVSEAGLVHDLARAGRDVAIVLAHLASLTSLDNGVDLQRSEHLVAHSVVVERQGEVSLDPEALSLADVVDPLVKAAALQAQEAEDSCVCLSLSLQFLDADDALEVTEPPALDHQPLDFLGLALLEVLCSVEPEGVESFSLQSKIKGEGTDLSVETERLSFACIEHD